MKCILNQNNQNERKSEMMRSVGQIKINNLTEFHT